MLGIGWYKKAQCDKKVFKYLEEHEEQGIKTAGQL